MENEWTKRIEELTKSRDDWKREWRLLNAGLNMAEDKIKELEAERDADRRREYGYSQQTVDALTVERDKLEAENQRLMDEIRDLEWKIYRPLKEGEMTQEGDQVLGPEEDAKWVPVTGNHRLTPSALYPAHCHYRRLIVDEIKKEMEGDYFYRKCVAGKESARSKRIKKLEAELSELKQEIQGWKNSRDGVLSQIEEMAQQLAEERREIERLKSDHACGDCPTLNAVVKEIERLKALSVVQENLPVPALRREIAGLREKNKTLEDSWQYKEVMKLEEKLRVMEEALTSILNCKIFGWKFDHCGAMNATQLSERDLYRKLWSRAQEVLAGKEEHGQE